MNQKSSKATGSEPEQSQSQTLSHRRNQRHRETKEEEKKAKRGSLDGRIEDGGDHRRRGSRQFETLGEERKWKAVFFLLAPGPKFYSIYLFYAKILLTKTIPLIKNHYAEYKQSQKSNNFKILHRKYEKKN